MSGKNIYWQERLVQREDRERRRAHRGAVLWFTGLSGSGKTTLATRLEERLFEAGCFTYVLDGDNIRHGLSSDLGFLHADRTENIRRVGEVAKLFLDAGALACTAFISPYREDRARVRGLMDRPGDFVEIFVSCPLEVCERRDPKGLYRKARAGEIQDFTGVSAPYEAPETPELVVETATQDVKASVDRILAYLRDHGYVAPATADDLFPARGLGAGP